MPFPHARPWRLVPGEGLPLIVSQGQPGYIAQFFDDDGNAQDNARLTLRAVNQHRDYQDFVRELSETVETSPSKVTAEWLQKKLDSLEGLLSWP